MEKNARELAQVKAGGLCLIAEARKDRFSPTVSYWISGEWYSPVCDLFHRTGLDMEHVEQLRALGHTVTIYEEGTAPPEAPATPAPAAPVQPALF
jgi:hypothetical protein